MSRWKISLQMRIDGKYYQCYRLKDETNEDTEENREYDMPMFKSEEAVKSYCLKLNKTEKGVN